MSLNNRNGRDAHVCFFFSFGLERYMLLGKCNYNKKYLSSFGGMTEEGETLKDTIIRECSEETLDSVVSRKNLENYLEKASTKIKYYEREGGKTACVAFVKLDYSFSFFKSRKRMRETLRICNLVNVELCDLVAVKVDILKKYIYENEKIPGNFILRPALEETLRSYFTDQ